MAELTREYLAEKRKMIEAQIHTLQGAIEMIDMLEGDFFPPTLDDVAQTLGAVSAELVPVESEGK